MRSAFLMMLLFAATGAAPASAPTTQESLPPTSRIAVETEVGATATYSRKVSVFVCAEIREGKTGVEIEAREPGIGRTTTLSIEIPQIKDLAAAIDRIARTAGKQQDTVTVANLVISTDSMKKDPVVKIHEAGEAVLAPDPIYLAPDNALAFTELLRRAEKVSAWISPRLEPLAK